MRNSLNEKRRKGKGEYVISSSEVVAVSSWCGARWRMKLITMEKLAKKYPHDDMSMLSCRKSATKLGGEN